MSNRDNQKQSFALMAATNKWFLLALVLLIVNDHFLKANYPSMITGKLSDFAGLLVFVVFLSVFLPNRWRTKTALVWLNVGVGVAFAVWKLAPVEVLLSEFQRLTHLPVPVRVKDATDLVALTILPVSYRILINRLKPQSDFPAGPVFQKYAVAVVLLITGWSIMATQKGIGYEAGCCEGLSGNVDFDGRDIVDIRDITFLEDYLYHGGMRPTCLLEADVNGTYDKNPVNQEDLIYLVDYVFGFGPEPCECIDW